MTQALGGRRGGTLALAAIVVGAAVLLWTQARRVGFFTSDEEYYVYVARLIGERFPAAIVDLPLMPHERRGMQRLNVLLLAWPLTHVNGTTGFELARGLMCLAFASAAVPVYLLARGLRLTARAALAAAALALLLPWAVVTSSLLTENVAYPAAHWAFYGAWRATVRRGLRVDLLALGLALVAALARTNLIALVALAPIAVTAQTFLAARPAPLRTRFAATVRQLRGEHPLLGAVLVLGLLLTAVQLAGVDVLGAAVGSYSSDLTGAPSALPDKIAGQLAPGVTGLGFLVAVVGTAGLGHWLVRPPHPAERGFAIVALVAVGLVTYTTLPAPPEERYLAPLAGLLVVATVAVLARRTVPWPWVAGAAAAAGALIASEPWPMVTDSAHYLTDPADTFFSRVVLGRVEAVMPGRPEVVMALACFAACTLLALTWRRPSSRVAVRATAAATLAFVAFQVAQTAYVVSEHARLTTGPATLGERTWVDEALPARASAALLLDGAASEPWFTATSRELTFWNRRAENVLTTDVARVPHPRYGEEIRPTVQPSGRLAGVGIPRYVVEPTLFRRSVVVAEELARSPYTALRLVRLAPPARLTHRWTGVASDGWIAATGVAVAQIFPPALRRASRPCLVVRVTAPAGAGRAVRFTLDAGGQRRSGWLAAGGGRSVRLPLTPRVDTVRVMSSGVARLADGRRVALQITSGEVGAC